MDKALKLIILLFSSFLACEGQVMPVILSGGVVTSGSATPTLIQTIATPSDTQSQSPFSSQSGNASIVSCFANSTQVGNTIVVRLTTASALSNIASVTDDGSSSNTYTRQKTEVVSSRTLAVYTAPVVDASRCVTVLYTVGTTAIDNEVKLYEFDNVATTSPLDASCSGSSTSGTAPACSSSMTPTVAGDLILAFVDIKTFTSTPTGAMTFTAQTGSTPTYTLLDADGTSWSASEYGVDSGTSAITPSITISQSTTQSQVVAIALKAASSGSNFSGIHVNNIAKFAPQFAFSNAITGTAQIVQFPCYGNDLWVLVGIGDNTTVSSINTDSNSNTWTGLTRVDSTGDGFSIQWYHSDSATCNGTEKFTINFAAAPSFLTVVAFDLSNATGYDSSATCAAGSTPCPINVSSGGDANSTTTVSGAKITPSTASGVVLSYQNQDFNSMCSVSPGNFGADIELGAGSIACGTGAATSVQYVGSGFEQDAGVLVDYYSSTAQISITWSMANTQSRAIGPEFSSTVAVKH